MKLRLPLLALMTGLILVIKAPAAPVQAADAGGPAIIVQVKAIDTLLETVKTTAKNFLPADAYREVSKELFSKIDPNQTKGIDTSKPMGLYAVIGKGLLEGDFSTTSFVALVPVSDQKDFIVLLTKMELKAEKKGEVYSIAIPNSPIDATLQFANGYAYISVSTEPLAAKNLLSPKELFEEKATAAAKLKIRLDRLPEDIKDKGLELLSETAENAKNEGPAEFKELRGDVAAAIAGWIKSGVKEGKELTVSLDMDSKAGTVVNEMSLEAKSGTELARSYNQVKPTTNTFASLIGPDSAASIMTAAPLFSDDLKKVVVKMIGEVKEQISKNVANAPPQIQDVATEFFKTLDRTVAAGKVDMAATLRGPDSNGQFTVVGALSLKDPSELEKSIKNLHAVAPKENADKVKLDVFTVEGVNVHEILVADKLDPKAEKVFGKSSVYVALAPSAAFVTFGPSGKEAMKEVLTKKFVAKPASMVQADASGKGLVALVKALGMPEGADAKAFLARLAQMDRVPVFNCKLEGGENKVTIRTEIGLLPFFGLSSSQQRPLPVPPQPAPAPLKPR